MIPIVMLRRTIVRAALLTAVISAVATLWAQPLNAAFDSEQRQKIDAINTYFNNIRHMHGDFVQFGPDGGRLEGKFFIRRPGKIRFQYSEPVRLEIISDGKSIAIRDRRMDTQDLLPLKKTPLRFLVADKIDLLTDAEVTKVIVEPDLVTVVIEQDSIFGDGKLTLVFDGAGSELRQWTITDAQGLETSIAIFNVETGQPANPKLFKIDYSISSTKGDR
jgi:outer membrane lipoprotein-sorting protein